MRGLLVVNPKATTTTATTRDVLVGALRSEMQLSLGYTRRRGHGFELAHQAAEEGVDVVVALGGDGTVNEVVNGLMAASSKPRQRPSLAVVPGGSTNVFARALGIPRDPVEATSVILRALRARSRRWIGLGLADDRHFTFCAGLGMDAAVVRRVEVARRRGRRSTAGLYLRSALSEYVDQARRRESALTLTMPNEAAQSGLADVIVQNTSPWTYLGSRPVHASVEASFDAGLDVTALRGLGLPTTMRTATQMLTARPRDNRISDADNASYGPHGKKVLVHHDVAEFTVTGNVATALQLDGDYLGEREKVRFAAVPQALRVIC